jgi:hypothetical protein
VIYFVTLVLGAFFSINLAMAVVWDKYAAADENRRAKEEQDLEDKLAKESRDSVQKKRALLDVQSRKKYAKLKSQGNISYIDDIEKRIEMMDREEYLKYKGGGERMNGDHGGRMSFSIINKLKSRSVEFQRNTKKKKKVYVASKRRNRWENSKMKLLILKERKTVERSYTANRSHWSSTKNKLVSMKNLFTTSSSSSKMILGENKINERERHHQHHYHQHLTAVPGSKALVPLMVMFRKKQKRRRKLGHHARNVKLLNRAINDSLHQVHAKKVATRLVSTFKNKKEVKNVEEKKVTIVEDKEGRKEERVERGWGGGKGWRDKR